MNHQPIIGDIYAVMNRIHNKWLLWQVIKDKNGITPQIGILMLDWFSEQLPNEHQLQKMKPLRINHHSWKGNYEALYVIDSPPNSALWIANMLPIIDLEINAYGGGWFSPNAAIRQFEWMEFAEAAHKTYKKALQSADKVPVMGRELKENSTSVWLYEKDGETHQKGK